jgi:signal peptidase I
MSSDGAPPVTGTGPDDAPTVAAATAAPDATATLPRVSEPPSPRLEPDPGDPGGPAGPGDSGAKDRKGTPDAKKPGWRVALEWLVLIAVALAIAFLIKSFLFQAFYIPSASMEPTLNIGDRVLVNKLSYDFHDVNRGDIVVFEAPPLARSGEIEDLVKRVIGLPGETVTFSGDGKVAIDGRTLREPYLPAGVDSCDPSLPCPNEAPGDAVPPGCGAPADGQPGCVVPKDHVFMMGDNREQSKDSRVFGPIAEDTIIGRVFLRIWPIDDLGFL